MILITTALYCEAKPIIKHFNLKKEPDTLKFNLYSNEDICLTVSGTGTLKAAIAATYLITHIHPKNVESMLNIGICGSLSKQFDPGTPILCNKIVNSETGRAFFPDMFLNHTFDEGTLVSFNSPVKRDSLDCSGDFFVDMEGAGFMEAASTFLAPHQLYCFKIVSDYLESTRMDPGFVSGLIEKNLQAMESLVKDSRMLNRDKHVLSPAELSLLDFVAEKLMLSVTMQHQFRKLAVQYRIRRKRPLDFLKAFIETKVQSKYEGKIQFEQIKRFLSE